MHGEFIGTHGYARGCIGIGYDPVGPVDLFCCVKSGSIEYHTCMKVSSEKGNQSKVRLVPKES